MILIEQQEFLIKKVFSKNQWFLYLIATKSPTFKYIITGSKKTTFEFSYLTLLKAKESIDEGRLFTNGYEEYEAELILSYLKEDKFKLLVQERVENINKNTPREFSKHCQLLKVYLDNKTITYHFILDNINYSEEELKEDKLQITFMCLKYFWGYIKMLDKYGYEERYVLINKSDNSIISDTSFDGLDLLQIYEISHSKD